MNKKQEVLEKIYKNQGRNFIQFDEYSDLNKVFPGIVPGRIYVVTGSTGTYKTTFIKNIILDLFNSAKKNGKKLKVMYFALEESYDEFYYSIMSIVATKYYGRYINVRELLGYEKLSSKTKHLLETTDIVEKTQEIFENIYFRDDLYDTDQMLKTVYKAATAFGSFVIHKKTTNETVKVPYNDAFTHRANTKIVYEKHDDTIVLPIIDHINMINGTDKYKDIEYLVDQVHKYICKKLDMPIILVHQQAFEVQNVQSIKTLKGRPTMQGLGNNKEVGRYYYYVLGLYDPFQFGIMEWNDVPLSPDTIVCLTLKTRDGKPKSMVYEFVDGTRYLRQKI